MSDSDTCANNALALEDGEIPSLATEHAAPGTMSPPKLKRCVTGLSSGADDSTELSSPPPTSAILEELKSPAEETDGDAIQKRNEELRQRLLDYVRSPQPMGEKIWECLNDLADVVYLVDKSEDPDVLESMIRCNIRTFKAQIKVASAACLQMDDFKNIAVHHSHTDHVSLKKKQRLFVCSVHTRHLRQTPLTPGGTILEQFMCMLYCVTGQFLSDR